MENKDVIYELECLAEEFKGTCWSEGNYIEALAKAIEFLKVQEIDRCADALEQKQKQKN